MEKLIEWRQKYSTRRGFNELSDLLCIGGFGIELRYGLSGL